MGINERKEREKLEMRKLILEAAMQLFIEEGYENVSIRKIADKIEYSPSSIYNYFPDKGDIFYELHREGFNLFYERQLSIQHIKDPVEKLIAHGRIYIEFAKNYPEYYDLMFIARSPGCKIHENEKWDCGDRSFYLLIQNTQECKDAGYFAGQDTNSVAFFMWSLIHGVTSLYLRRSLILEKLNAKHFDELIEKTLQIFRTVIK